MHFTGIMDTTQDAPVHLERLSDSCGFLLRSLSTTHLTACRQIPAVNVGMSRSTFANKLYIQGVASAFSFLPLLLVNETQGLLNELPLEKCEVQRTNNAIVR